MALRIPPKPFKTLKELFSLTKPIEAKRDTNTKPLAVKRDTTPYIERQGWKRSNGFYPVTWQGWYRTRGGSWEGKITASTPPQFYIYKPPEALTTKHSHKACFHRRSDGWCDVHFRIIPGDLSSGIIKLERILYEAYVLQKSA